MAVIFKIKKIRKAKEKSGVGDGFVQVKEDFEKQSDLESSCRTPLTLVMMTSMFQISVSMQKTIFWERPMTPQS
jgi:hypothetical protein